MNKPIKPLTVKEEKKIRKAFSDARKNINSACEKRGRELVKEAEDNRRARLNTSRKNTEATSKEIANYIAGIAKDRKIFSTNIETKCLLCEYRKGHLDKCLPCQDFSNFKERGGLR